MTVERCWCGNPLALIDEKLQCPVHGEKTTLPYTPDEDEVGFTYLELESVMLVDGTIECKTCEKATPPRFLVFEWFGPQPFRHPFCSADCLRVWAKLQADRIFQPSKLEDKGK